MPWIELHQAAFALQQLREPRGGAVALIESRTVMLPDLHRHDAMLTLQPQLQRGQPWSLQCQFAWRQRRANQCQAGELALREEASHRRDDHPASIVLDALWRELCVAQIHAVR